jgi:two-component system, sporulation sensor kinase B
VKNLVDIQNLLCNILFVIFPYLISEVFFPERTKAAKWMLTFLSALSIFLCMRFPIIHLSGQVVDLRLIPFLFAFLYGGWRIGLLLLLFLCSYRFVLGGSGAYANLFSFLILLIALFPASSYYHRVSFKFKVRLVIILTILHYIIIVGAHMILGTLSIVDLWIILIQPTITVFMTFMIEKHQENQAIREQIHRSEKLQAISDIAASVSHEIRNPMTVVRGFVQLMLQDNISEKYQSYLELSIDELNRAEKIITNYLAYARPQPDKTEFIPLDEELQHVASILIPFANLHQVEVAVSILQQGHVWGDRLKLRQALLNLMKNGIEAMPDGGILTIQLHRLYQQLCIHIQDTGIGMTRNQIQRLGTPYYSLKEKGTGLGTMVSFRVIESMNGKVEIHSEIGKGTTFSLYFPIFTVEDAK